MPSFTWTVNGTPTNATSVKFSNVEGQATGDYGMIRQDNLDVIIADGEDWDNVGTGLYDYDFTPLALEDGVVYNYFIKVYYAGLYHVFQVNWGADSNTEGGEELTNVNLQFAVVNLGVLELADSTPKLSNQSNSYGVVVDGTGEVVVANNTPMTAVGTMYRASFGEAEPNLTYRYYIEAVVDGVTYYLPRTTSYVRSSALVIGRYADSTLIEQRFGVENVHKWLGVSDTDEATDYGFRYAGEVAAAEQEVDDYLRNVLPVPLTTVPSAITDIAIDLIACRLYESRGVVDFNQDTGAPAHRLGYAKKRALDKLRDIKSGMYRLAIDETIRYPRFEETELPEDVTWINSWDTWS